LLINTINGDLLNFNYNNKTYTKHIGAALDKQFKLFGITIDRLNMQETVQVIREWLQAQERSCKYVVTPNVDHVVVLEKNIKFQQAYDKAALTVIDGNPVLWVARMLGEPVPSTVRGSDLTPAIFACCNTNHEQVKVFLLGAAVGVADRAAANITQQWPFVSVVGTMSPPYGFEKSSAESDTICNAVNASGADLLVIGLGAPKQELWVHQYQQQLSVKVALCVGATIDFMAGEKSRAPVWMRKAYLEWLHRALSEPKRLGMRYLKDGIVFPRLVLKEYFAKKRI
jgi:N-acetylglucosaminyldiphosphoundecaprenol N-acetyl-beta-D-mannosaminyltransferase